METEPVLVPVITRAAQVEPTTVAGKMIRVGENETVGVEDTLVE